MSLFYIRTPGKNLIDSNSQRQFEEVRVLIEQCCNDLLIRPDYDASMRCVDAVNNIRNPQVIEEVVYCLRQKMGARQSTRTVFMAVSLIEMLVKNCGMRLHAAIGQASFMDDLVKVAKKYVGKTGEYCRDVAELILDVIQAWGEAFLPRQRQFPHIVGAYHTLRKEGFPFKAQYDPSRVPIFTPAGNVSKDQMTEDEILSAALAASMGDFENAGDRNGGERNFLTSEGQKKNMPSSDRSIESRRGSKSNTYGEGSAPPEGRVLSYHDGSSSSNNSDGGAKEAVQTSLTLLAEIILSATSIEDLMNNDIAHDLFIQLEQVMSKIPHIIENELMRNPSNLDEKLFELNDNAQLVHSNYSSLKRRLQSLSAAQKNLQRFSTPQSQIKKAEANIDKTFHLLQDFGVLQVSPEASSQTIEMSTNVNNAIHRKEVQSKRPSGGSIPVLQPPNSERRTSKTSIVDDPFNLNSSELSTSVTRDSGSKTTLLDDLFGTAPTQSVPSLSVSTASTSDPFFDPFSKSTVSAIDSLLPSQTQTSNKPNKVDPLSLYQNQSQQKTPATYLQMPTPMPVIPMQAPMMSVPAPIMQSPMMQAPIMPMQAPIMPMQAPIIQTHQLGAAIPPSGHVSQLIQKFDPNSPTKKAQSNNEQKQSNDSNNPFDLF